MGHGDGLKEWRGGGAGRVGRRGGGAGLIRIVFVTHAFKFSHDSYQFQCYLKSSLTEKYGLDIPLVECLNVFV